MVAHGCYRIGLAISANFQLEKLAPIHMARDWHGTATDSLDYSDAPPRGVIGQQLSVKIVCGADMELPIINLLLLSTFRLAAFHSLIHGFTIGQV